MSAAASTVEWEALTSLDELEWASPALNPVRFLLLPPAFGLSTIVLSLEVGVRVGFLPPLAVVALLGVGSAAALGWFTLQFPSASPGQWVRTNYYTLDLGAIGDHVVYDLGDDQFIIEFEDGGYTYRFSGVATTQFHLLSVKHVTVCIRTTDTPPEIDEDERVLSGKTVDIRYKPDEDLLSDISDSNLDQATPT